jgi:hypothetical protein
MELYNGEKIRTPVLLSKALELIGDLPTSVELKENCISFENQFYQKVKFQRLFHDVWKLELKFYGHSEKKIELIYKYIRTRMVKAIVINLFYGIFIGTLNLGKPSLINHESRNQRLKQVITLIDAKLENYSLCKYCGKELPYNLKEECEYCGTRLNFGEILLVELIF